MELFNKLLSIGFSVLILYNATYIKKFTGTWLTPGCLFSLFWFSYTFFPLVIMFEVYINALSVGYIALLVIAFSWTSFFFNWKTAFIENLNKPNLSIIFNTFILRSLLVFSIIFSVFCCIMQLKAQGFTLHEIFTDTILMASKFAHSRYTSALVETVYGPLCLTFSFLSVLIGGIMFSAVAKRKRKWILFCFLPSLVVLLTQSAKGLFFGGIFFFLGGVLVTSIYENKLLLLKVNNIGKMAKVGLFSVFIITLSFMSRGLQDIHKVSLLLEKLRGLFASYFFAHLYDFSDWLDAYLGINCKMDYDTSHYYYGYLTFTTFFNKIGIHYDRTIGVYDEFNLSDGGMESNVYTIFRGLVMDFGLLGALIFILLLGFFLNYIYICFLHKKNPIIEIPIVIFMLAFFYQTFIISFFTWNIIPFIFILFTAILFINKYKFVIKKNN